MKRFIITIIMALMCFVALAQYNERGKFVVESLRSELQSQQTIDQLKTELGYSEKWDEWKSAQTKIAQGKAFMYAGAAMGAITTGVCLSIISANKREIANGKMYYERAWEDGSMVKMSYDSINKKVSTIMWTLDAISIAAAIYGIYQRSRGRSELDRIYSNVYFNGRGVSVHF